MAGKKDLRNDNSVIQYTDWGNKPWQRITLFLRKLLHIPNGGRILICLHRPFCSLRIGIENSTANMGIRALKEIDIYVVGFPQEVKLRDRSQMQDIGK